MREARQTLRQDPVKTALKKARDNGLKRAMYLLQENIIDKETYWKVIASLPVVTFNQKKSDHSHFKSIPKSIDTSGIVLTENRDGILIPHILLGRFSKKDGKQKYSLPKIKKPQKPIEIKPKSTKISLPVEKPDETYTRSNSPLSMISDSEYQQED